VSLLLGFAGFSDPAIAVAFPPAGFIVCDRGHDASIESLREPHKTQASMMPGIFFCFDFFVLHGVVSVDVIDKKMDTRSPMGTVLTSCS